MSRRFLIMFAAVLICAAALTALLAQAPAVAVPPKKHLLAIGDVRSGFQHDSVSHALATIERLGRESNLYDTYIRTDCQLVTKQKIDGGNAKKGFLVAVTEKRTRKEIDALAEAERGRARLRAAAIARNALRSDRAAVAARAAVVRVEVDVDAGSVAIAEARGTDLRAPSLKAHVGRAGLATAAAVGRVAGEIDALAIAERRLLPDRARTSAPLASSPRGARVAAESAVVRIGGERRALAEAVHLPRCAGDRRTHPAAAEGAGSAGGPARAAIGAARRQVDALAVALGRPLTETPAFS